MIYFLLLFLWILPLQTRDCGCETKPHINTLAVVNGIKITQQDLSIDTRTQIRLAQETVINARNQEVRLQIDRMLVDGEAKRRGISREKLLQLEITDKVTPPTDDEVKDFYLRNKKRLPQDFKEVKNEIFASIKADRELTRANEFAKTLLDGAKITISELAVTPPANEADLERVFATVNGVNITSQDVEQSLLPLIFKVQQQVYAFRKQDVDLKINDILLDQEAKRLGMSPQSLINQNVKARVPIVTKEQARAYYNANKKTAPGDFDELEEQIMRYLLAQEERKLVLAYAEQLRKNAAVQIYLIEPVSPTLRQLCCNPVD